MFSNITKQYAQT